MENKMLDDPNRKYVPKKEFITYSVSALGQGMIYAIMSSYISDFYLNVLRVTPIFVLLLMFLARIWDEKKSIPLFISKCSGEADGI